MNLILDIGNTRLKAALFKDSEMIAEYNSMRSEDAELPIPDSMLSEVKACIVSEVATTPSKIAHLIDSLGITPIKLHAELPLPFENKYESKQSLGHDRIAAIAAACALYPGKNVCVIDAGTALTIDLKTSREEYLGGIISTGLAMRFKALHEFTARLPLLTARETGSLFGNSTETSIINGVQNGLIFEINSYIDELHTKYPELVVLLTGGDLHFFDNKLKKPIFVLSNLTLLGLNFILQYNAKNL